MQSKIENRSYKYQGNNICSIYATLNIYDDNTNIIDTVKLSANFDITLIDTLKEDINTQLSGQISDYMEKFTLINNVREQLFPDANTFMDVVNTIFDPIEKSIN